MLNSIEFTFYTGYVRQSKMDSILIHDPNYKQFEHSLNLKKVKIKDIYLHCILDE